MSGDRCPCGAEAGYAGCCGRYVDGHEAAPSAEALMRSRYSAFARADTEYLLRTWHPDTRPARLEADARTRWLGLRIVRVERGQAGDTEGLVEFVARYKIGGRGHRLHETSRFSFEHGGWLYVDGDVERR